MRKFFFIFFLFINSSNAFALDLKTNFTKEVFEQAQANGKTVIVYSWNKFCMTCAKQKPILEQAEKDFTEVLFLNYEQTKYKNIAEYLNISYWSTIAVYKGNKQIDKAIGVYKKDEIYLLINKGI